VRSEIVEGSGVELSRIVYAEVPVGTSGDDLILRGPGERPYSVRLD